MKLYRSSPYLIIDSSEKQGNKLHKLYNTLTGQAYHLTQKIIEIIEFISSDKKEEEIIEYFSEYGNEDIREILIFLCEKKILFEKESTLDQLCVLTKIKQTLMEFDDRMEFGKHYVTVIGVPFALGNPESNGSAYFPDALRGLSKKYHLHYKSILSSPVQAKAIGLVGNSLSKAIRNDLIKDLGNLFINFSETRSYVYHKIEQMALALFCQGQVPVFLGGDHSISLSTIKAASQVHQGLRVIHLDAHTDLYASKYDKLDHEEKVYHHGNFMKEIVRLPEVRSIHQLGIRGIQNIAQKEISDKHQIVWAQDMKEMLRFRKAVPLGLEQEDLVYITIDIDILDPSIAMGTSTPVIGGISYEELTMILQQISEQSRVVGVDLVEVDPQKDVGELTMQVAMQIVWRLLDIVSREILTENQVL